MPSDVVTLQSILEEMKTNHIELSSKIDSIKSDLTGMISAVKDELNGKIINIRNELSNCIVESNHKTCAIADSIERMKKLGDLVIVGVPYDKNENVANIFLTLCLKINFDISHKPHDIFRAGPRTTSSSSIHTANASPIILKFGDKHNANALLKHFYACKPLLKAADLGFATTTNIYISNSLTTLDRQIFSKCMQLKSQKLISRIMVIDGVVNIQMASNTPRVQIPSLQILDEFHKSIASLNIQQINHINSLDNNLKRKPSSPPSLTNPTKTASTSGGLFH